MHPIFYFIILFLALGIFSLIAKIVVMLHSTSGVSAMDVSDLLASVFLTGFAGGCGLLVLENEHSHSLVPGFAVLAVAAVVMAVSIAIRSFAGGVKGTNTQTIDVTGLERRKAIVEKSSATPAKVWRRLIWRTFRLRRKRRSSLGCFLCCSFCLV